MASDNIQFYMFSVFIGLFHSDNAQVLPIDFPRAFPDKRLLATTKRCQAKGTQILQYDAHFARGERR